MRIRELNAYESTRNERNNTMKITSFNPQIITNNAEPIVKLFEEIGFEVSHDQKGIGTLSVEGIRMKNGDGFHLDISQPGIDLPGEITAIRMNVDDFDEAYQMLTEHGFKNFYGDKAVEMKRAKSAMMISPSGFAINLIQHIKE